MTGMEQFNIQNRQSKNSNSNVFNCKQSNPDLTTRRKAPMSATKTHWPTPWLMATSSQTNPTLGPHNWTNAEPRFSKFIPPAKVEILWVNLKEMDLRTSVQMCQLVQAATAESLIQLFINLASRATTTKTHSCRTSTSSPLTMAKRTIKTRSHKQLPCSSKCINTWSWTHTTSITVHFRTSRITSA